MSRSRLELEDGLVFEKPQQRFVEAIHRKQQHALEIKSWAEYSATCLHTC